MENKLKKYINKLIFPLLVFTNSYSMEKCQKIKEEPKKESKEFKKRKFVELSSTQKESNNEQAPNATYPKKFRHECEFVDKKLKKELKSTKKSSKRELDQSENEKKDSEDNNQKFDDKLTDLINEINQILELLQNLNTQTAEDTKNSLKEKLITAKAFLISTALPPELNYNILLLVFQEYISSTINRHLENIDKMIPEEIFESLDGIKNEVEKHIANFLIFLHDLEISMNKIKEEKNKVSALIEYKNRFLKDLSPYFQQAIIEKLKNLPSQTKTIFCDNLLELMSTQANKINPENYNLKAYKNPWKFVIDPLMQTLPITDYQTHHLVRWVVQEDKHELMKKILHNTNCFKDYKLALPEYKLTLLYIAIDNYAFETAKLFISYKFNLSQENFFINSIVRALRLLTIKPNDEKLINECHELIKLLFDSGTMLKVVMHESRIGNRSIATPNLGIREITAYNEAIEANPLLREMENNDPDNSINKLIEDAKRKAAENKIQ